MPTAEPKPSSSSCVVSKQSAERRERERDSEIRAVVVAMSILLCMVVCLLDLFLFY